MHSGTLQAKRNAHAVPLPSKLLQVKLMEYINHVVGYHSACGNHFAGCARCMRQYTYPA